MNDSMASIDASIKKLEQENNFSNYEKRETALEGFAANVVLKYDKGDYLAKVRMLEEIGTTLRFQFLNK